jgi:phage FluMu protein gp41
LKGITPVHPKGCTPDIVNNQITSASNMGTVGLNFQVAGFGDFNGDSSTDMILRNSKTGQFEVYDIRNNAITSASDMGTVGLEWQVAGFGPFHGPGASDMVLRNVNTGEFEVYDIVKNQIRGAALLGQVGLDWQVGGFAVDPPTVSGTFTDISNDQLVQAMAGLGGDAADDSNSVFLGDDTSQQTFLTPPQAA